MPRLSRTVAPVLDGAVVEINPNNQPTPLRIDAGEYETPFWILSNGGQPVFRVDSLPWQGVIPPP